MQDNAKAGLSSHGGFVEGAPANAKLILATLIIVAAVANLPLAMANIALPSIGTAFNRVPHKSISCRAQANYT